VISPAALKAKITDRVEYLSWPKIENEYWDSYYLPTTSSRKDKIKTISDRLIELSQPRTFKDDT